MKENKKCPSYDSGYCVTAPTPYSIKCSDMTGCAWHDDEKFNEMNKKYNKKGKTGMKIEDVYESEKIFTIQLSDEMNDYEHIEVRMCSEFADPASKYFTHCEVKINSIKNRNIDGHIEYLQTICEALKQLKEKLGG